MVIVSTRDFRQNQTRYLNLANDGESVVLRSRLGNYRIVPVTENDIVEKRDVISGLRDALQEVREALSNNKKLQSLDSLIDEL